MIGPVLHLHVLSRKALLIYYSFSANVEIELPVPSDATNPNIWTSMGSVGYASENDALMWKIKSFRSSKEYMLRAEFTFPSITDEEAAPERKALIRVKCEIRLLLHDGASCCCSLFSTDNHAAIRLLFAFHCFCTLSDEDLIKLTKMYSAFTCQPLEKVQQNTERDRFLSVSEAMEFGLIDGILKQNTKCRIKFRAISYATFVGVVPVLIIMSPLLFIFHRLFPRRRWLLYSEVIGQKENVHCTAFDYLVISEPEMQVLVPVLPEESIP
ncbi:unnamed protein product [Ilex paraguariensis]|uniref:MHD domain-containing protein n=1 Tax=Ilex paraguariensis TaxID=185542 RepID=A0ABC8RL41_9AQUA